MQTCTRLRRRNAIVKSDGSGSKGLTPSLHLPVLSLLCAWARHLKTRTQRGQAIRTYVRPASKTPVNQKNLSS